MLKLEQWRNGVNASSKSPGAASTKKWVKRSGLTRDKCVAGKQVADPRIDRSQLHRSKTKPSASTSEKHPVVHLISQSTQWELKFSKLHMLPTFSIEQPHCEIKAPTSEFTGILLLGHSDSKTTLAPRNAEARTRLQASKRLDEFPCK